MTELENQMDDMFEEDETRPEREQTPEDREEQESLDDVLDVLLGDGEEETSKPAKRPEKPKAEERKAEAPAPERESAEGRFEPEPEPIATTPIPPMPELDIEGQGEESEQAEELEPDLKIDQPDPDAKIEKRRSRILNIMLTSLTAIATLAISFLVVILVQNDAPWSLLSTYAPYFVAYIFLVVMTLSRGVDHTLRAYFLVFLSYAVGINALWQEGSFSAGPFYLIVGPLFLSLLVRPRAGAYAAALSSFIYAGFMLAEHMGARPPTQPPMVLSGVITMSLTFVMLVAAAMFVQWMFNSALTSAMQELQETNRKAVRSRELLRQRAKELGQTNVLLQKRTKQLQAAVQVSRVAASVHDLEQMMQETVELIRRRLDVYHVALFLIDDSGNWAVLRAATGQAGREMMDEKYWVEVGNTSAVGRCVLAGEPQTVADLGERAVMMESLTDQLISPVDEASFERLSQGNPYLPEARSSTALPLRSRRQAIGALEVYSDQPDDFSQEDIAVLQIVADAIAAAIDNAQLFAQTRARLEEAESRQGQITRERWEYLVPGKVSPFQERARPDAEPLDQATLAQIELALASEEMGVLADPVDGEPALAASISVRGEVIGVLGLQGADEDREWTADEIALLEAVADQMSLALENARLLEETRQRAAQEEALGEMTTRFTQSLDLDALLRVAVRELGQLPNVAQASIQVAPKKPGTGKLSGGNGDGADGRGKRSR